MSERRQSLEKEEATFDPLSMLMADNESAQRPPKSTRLSGFDVADLESDLGMTSNKNLTPARAGAKKVSVGEDFVSPAPVALPPADKEHIRATTTATSPSTEETVQETPPLPPTLPPTAHSASIPFIAGKDRTDTPDGLSTDVLGSLGTAATTTGTSNSVAMRVAKIDPVTLTRIEQESQCTITFVDANEQEQSLTIEGTPTNIKQAQTLVRRHIASTTNIEQPLITGEFGIYVDTKKASYVGPYGKSPPMIGRLRITDYRLIFEPEDQTTSQARSLMSSGLFIIPLFAMLKFKTSIKNNNTNNFFLNVVCKDVRSLVFDIATEPQITAGRVEQIATMFVFPFSSQQPVEVMFASTSRTALAKKAKEEQEEQEAVKKKKKKTTETEGEHKETPSSAATATTTATALTAPATEESVSGWQVYDVDREVQRQSKRGQSDFQSWFQTHLRPCRLNEKYELCKTYPNKLYAPATANDQVVAGASPFVVVAVVFLFNQFYQTISCFKTHLLFCAFCAFQVVLPFVPKIDCQCFPMSMII